MTQNKFSGWLDFSVSIKMASEKELDQELNEQAPPRDLHSLRAANPALDARARKIQLNAFELAVEILEKEPAVVNKLSKRKVRKIKSFC